MKLRKIKIKEPEIIFLLLVFVGVGLGILSLFLPPIGIIDSSVIIVIAQIFLLAAGVLGFTCDISLKDGKFEINDKDDN